MTPSATAGNRRHSNRARYLHTTNAEPNGQSSGLHFHPRDLQVAAIFWTPPLGCAIMGFGASPYCSLLNAVAVPQTDRVVLHRPWQMGRPRWTSARLSLSAPGGR